MARDDSDVAFSQASAWYGRFFERAVQIGVCVCFMFVGGGGCCKRKEEKKGGINDIREMTKHTEGILKHSSPMMILIKRNNHHFII